MAWADIIAPPGAITSGFILPSPVGPRLEYISLEWSSLTEPTVIALTLSPGYDTEPGCAAKPKLPLPIATTVTIPASTATSNACEIEEPPLLVAPGITIGPPNESDITSIENLSLFCIVQSTALSKSPSSPEPPSKAITPTKLA